MTPHRRAGLEGSVRVDRTRLARVAKFAVLGLAASLAVGYVGISYLAASGVTSPEREQQRDHPSDYGLEYEDVRFPSRKGDVTLEGWYLPSPHCGPTVIFVHGIGSTRSGGQATVMAGRFVDQGFNVLLFDLRAHGSSGGDRITGGIDEAQDVLGAYDYLLSRGVPDTIGVLGRSMGAGTAVLAAAEEPGIRGLVLDSTYASVSDLAAFEIGRKTLIPQWVAPVFVPAAKLTANALYGVDMEKLVPERAVGEVEFPILLMHGEDDTRIPADHGVRVYEASHPGSEIWLEPGVGHGGLFDSYPDDYLDRAVSYFRERLTE